MYRAHELSRRFPKGKSIRALDPDTDVWKEGIVISSYVEKRIDADLDQGLLIDFGKGSRAINHRFIDC